MEDYYVNINKLSRMLDASPNTLRKKWRLLPHIFVGEGKDLRGARFNFHEVVEQFKKGGKQ